ncbi:MAG TPA: hypothetical protein PKV86_02125 [Syntrophobacteraceae bacterium]|nr:hypothetical protein [Syntrophobacteraceae bacterium]
MPDRSPHNEPPWSLPSHFFEWLIKDIPAETWIQFIRNHPSLKEAVFEGFGVPAGKIGRILRQPQIVARLQRIVRSAPSIFDEILQVWGQEQLDTMAFMEMLDLSFLLENSRSLKNFIGPKQFFAGLYLLGYLKEKGFQGLINEEFWEHPIEMEILEPLAPFLHLWNRFAQQHPQAKNWLERLRARLLPALLATGMGFILVYGIGDYPDNVIRHAQFFLAGLALAWTLTVAGRSERVT